MAVPQTIVVSSTTELESAMMSYLARGFAVTSRTPTEAVLIKRKEFSIAMVIIGLLLCVLPLLVYLLYYSAQQDQVVVIRLAVPPPQADVGRKAGAGTAQELQWSPDRSAWWNGTSWVDVAEELPPGVTLSGDERQWWDGEVWRVVQPGARYRKQ